jgi:hypothetical protein
MHSMRHLPRTALSALALVVGLGCSDSCRPSKTAGAQRSSAAAGNSGSSSATDVSGAGSSASGYTLTYDDPTFNELFVDVDEWRDEPVRHHYVHGGFKDTDARFSIYFPPEDKYQGRFFQYIFPVTGNEHTVTMPEYPDPSYPIGFAVDSGAYLIETNGGKMDFLPTDDPEISLWRASAAVAEHSRVLANQYYRDAARDRFDRRRRMGLRGHRRVPGHVGSQGHEEYARRSEHQLRVQQAGHVFPSRPRQRAPQRRWGDTLCKDPKPRSRPRRSKGSELGRLEPAFTSGRARSYCCRKPCRTPPRHPCTSGLRR